MLESLIQRARAVMSPGADDATTRTRHRPVQPVVLLHCRPARYLIGAALVAVGLVAGWLVSTQIAPSAPSAAAPDTSDLAAGTTLWAPDGADAHPVSCGTSTHRVRSPVCDQAWAITAPNSG